MSCVIEGCKSHTGRKKNDQEVISFHRFPKNKSIKDHWIKKVNRKHWNCNECSRICSRHFTPNSFIPNSNLKWRRLKPDAIPTLHIIASDTFERPIVPMDVSCGENVQVSYRVFGESQSNIEGPKSLESGQACLMEICDIETPTESCADVSLAHAQKEVEPLAYTKQGCDTSAQPVCNQMHEKTILELQRKLERVEKISRHRLQKINTLTKRLSRLGRKTYDIYSILMDKLKQENVGIEHLMLLESESEII